MFPHAYPFVASSPSISIPCIDSFDISSCSFLYISWHRAQPCMTDACLEPQGRQNHFHLDETLIPSSRYMLLHSTTLHAIPKWNLRESKNPIHFANLLNLDL